MSYWVLVGVQNSELDGEGRNWAGQSEMVGDREVGGRNRQKISEAVWGVMVVGWLRVVKLFSYF